jgi:Tfp pilus assembly PilM family ATPase
MVKRCIGIDISSSGLRAVQVSRTADGFCVDKAYCTKMRRSSDSPPGIIKSLIGKHGFDSKAQVAISMPQEAVFFRNLESDAAGLEQLLELSKAARPDQDHPASGATWEHSFPLPPEQTLVQVHSHRPLSDEKHSALAVGVAAKQLHHRVDLVVEANKHPALVDAAIFAIHSTVAINHPESAAGTAIIAYLDETHLALAVVRDNSVLIVRNIPIADGSPDDSDIDSVEERVAQILVREVRITWAKLFGKEIDEGTRVYLSTAGDAANSLKTVIEENLQCRTIVVDPYANMQCPDKCDNAAVCLAEGLALRVLAPEKTAGVSFRDAGADGAKTGVALKKEFAVCAVLAGVIALAWLLGLVVRFSRLEAKHSHMKSQVQQIFEQTLPNERNIVNPLAQLEHKLQSLGADYALSGYVVGTDMGPLEILKAITTEAPMDKNMDISSMLITAESVRVTGTSRSFDSVYKWQRRLQQIPQFSTVDVRKGSESDPVQFTILISLAKPEQL